MRVKPTAVISALLLIGYMGIITAIWKAYDVNYDTIGDSVQNVKEGIVYPVGVGALFLIIAATVLGWWRPAMREELRLSSKLLKIIPVALLLGAIVNLVATNWDNVESKFILWLAIGVLLVGFSEELLCRGLVLVGARGSFSEFKAMFFSAVLFGLLHGLNAFFGQSVGATMQQIVFAAVLGVVYYAVRRGTGGLIIPMILHSLWDGALFVNDHSKADPSPLSNLFMLIALVCTVIALRHESKHATSGEVVATA